MTARRSGDNRLGWVLLVALGIGPLGLAAEPGVVRSLRVPLPGQSANAIRESWPGVGCWFWRTNEFVGEGYRGFLDLAERHSAFRLLTTSIRAPVEVTEVGVHDQLKRAAEYGRERGLALVLDLDVRLARGAFMRAHPGELQEIVRLREVGLQAGGEVELVVPTAGGGDHYTFRAPPYDPIDSRLLRVYSGVRTPGGLAAAGSVTDITSRCRVGEADVRRVRVAIPCLAEDAGRTAWVLAAHSLFTPDVFAPHLLEFERSILGQYADVPLAGACKDEWGFPGGMANRTNLWFSPAMAAAYERRRPGRELARDLLLMGIGEEGREAERAAAINHYAELCWQRNAEVETAFFHATREVFGPEALVGTHPTWFPYPNELEVFKNGLSWWASRRDLAQTDEATPFAARTALAKKWNSPLWFNMYYDRTPESYQADVWRHVLGGGRMNFHPLYPGPWETQPWALARSRVLQTAARVDLLNLIATAPVDCPVAVVFGHPAALNWAGAGFGDVGMAVCDGLWAEGFYTDLIPSSEIALGNLRWTADGAVQYGPQRYAAVVWYHPEFERAEVAAFFGRAVGQGSTAVFRVGEATRDFEGQRLAPGCALPAPPVLPGGTADVVAAVIRHLRMAGIQPQTPGTLRGVAGFAGSVMPRPSGQCRLLDGTVVLVAGATNVLGDPLRARIEVAGRGVEFDAAGFAAVRLDTAGRVEAVAAAGLRRFRGPGLALELPDRVDLALWRVDGRAWRGAWIQDGRPLPGPLARLTRDWTPLRLPQLLDRP